MPTASITASQDAAVATSVATASGGGPAASAALPARIRLEICANLVPARMASTTRQIPPATRKRFPPDRRLPSGWEGIDTE